MLTTVPMLLRAAQMVAVEGSAIVQPRSLIEGRDLLPCPHYLRPRTILTSALDAELLRVTHSVALVGARNCLRLLVRL